MAETVSTRIVTPAIPSADSPQPAQAASRDTTVLPLALRLLAHPTYGAQGISDEERKHLLDAARAIEQIGVDLARLTERVRDLSIECDQLRGMSA